MPTIEQEVKEAIRKLQLLPKEFDKKSRQKMLREAGKPLVTAARRNIDDSAEEHFVYRNTKGKKSAKGEGQIVAVITPGNVRKSIRFLTFKKSASVFVGPFVPRGSLAGRYAGGKVNGYYAAWLEFGTRNITAQAYMRRAVGSEGTTVQNNVIKLAKKKVDDYIRKNKV